MENQELKVSSGGIMLPSPLTLNASRHGRGKHGGSISKNKVRSRGYSVVDEREWLISKALSKVLKHTVDENENEDDSDGWANCEDILARSDLSALEVTFAELKAICDNPKSKFTIRIKPGSLVSENHTSSAYLIRINPSPATATANSINSILKPLNSNTIDLPKLIIYETSYANYPLILASGGIKRASGQIYLSFKAISLIGTTELPPVMADVTIYIDLPSAIEANKNILWQQNESGVVVTEGDEGMVGKSLWKSAVARRIDIGVLFEDGQVKKEIPLSLRGKGAKVKIRGKTKGNDMNEIVTLGENEGKGN
ncbi:putative trna 2 -phosphotransferase 1 protein [Erysiphe neolycopersici]|uniref:2'-phosphotransferase n=1 Tax=Erysiphe neolycopersici TaxID=212602 RepID=A0A420HNJ9_9PEZI|nr:putative trna 2 -phosphotransferase 1 protein [Erysiphe neolycopersici]